MENAKGKRWKTEMHIEVSQKYVILQIALVWIMTVFF